MGTGDEPVGAMADRSTKDTTDGDFFLKKEKKHILLARFLTVAAGVLDTALGAESFADAHERLAKLVPAVPSTIAPKRVGRHDVDELGGVSAEEQRAEFSVLAALQIQHLVHLSFQPNQPLFTPT